jgi:spermidine/putrescine-binding protein
MDPEVLEEFEEEFGVKVTEDTFASNEEMLAKLQGGATGYDIVFPSDYMVDIMIEEGLLAEMDHENVPNIKNIDPLFADPPYDSGMEHCIPYMWGTTGLGYNQEVFDEPPESWGYVFDPAMVGDYAGQITMLDDVREAMGAALKYLGYSINTTDEDKLAEARDLLIQQKQMLYGYEAENYAPLISSDETVIAHGYNGYFLMTAMEDERIWYTIPKEGATIWADNMCIPKSAPNKYTAEVFIDFILRPEISAKLVNYLWYPSPNGAAEEFIDAEILNDPAIYPPDDVMDRLEWIEDVGDATPLYERMWTEVKAAGS